MIRHVILNHSKLCLSLTVMATNRKELTVYWTDKHVEISLDIEIFSLSNHIVHLNSVGLDGKDVPIIKFLIILYMYGTYMYQDGKLSNILK